MPMPQIRKKSRFSDGQAMFGHQVGVCHHVGATIVVVWHCMCILQGHNVLGFCWWEVRVIRVVRNNLGLEET